MSEQRKDQNEQLAREIAREAGFLPERWRLWLFERLREDYESFDKEQHRIDQLNHRMSEAVRALDRVAQWLNLTDQAAQLAITMSQFDAAPERVREGWKARRVAEAMRGSWELAKGVAFGEERLPVIPERFWERSKKLARKRREAALILSGIQDWLASKPKDKMRATYEQWRKTRNKQRSGQKPLPGTDAIKDRWQLDWAEIVKAVEEGRVPGESSDQPDEQPQAKEDGPQERSAPPSRAGSYVLDPELRARRLREARKAKGLTMNQVSKQIGIGRSHLGKIESGQVKQTTFETMVKLAEVLDLTLDDFVTEDEDRVSQSA